MRYQITWLEDPRIRPMLSRLAGPEALETVHKRFAVALQKWSDQNFDRGGSPKWKPLSPNTIAQRRKGSSIPLRDTGELELSMQTGYNGDMASLHSRDKRAKWHQEGTPPYIIRPKNGKFLAFRVAGGGNAMYAVRSTVSISRRTKSGRLQTKNVKVYGYRGLGAGETGNALFVREVHHPGLTARPLLPTEQQVWDEVNPVGIVHGFIEEVKRGG